MHGRRGPLDVRRRHMGMRRHMLGRLPALNGHRRRVMRDAARRSRMDRAFVVWRHVLFFDRLRSCRAGFCGARRLWLRRFLVPMRRDHAGTAERSGTRRGRDRRLAVVVGYSLLRILGGRFSLLGLRPGRAHMFLVTCRGFLRRRAALRAAEAAVMACA
jgi:hypothetical protein